MIYEAIDEKLSETPYPVYVVVSYHWENMNPIGIQTVREFCIN